MTEVNVKQRVYFDNDEMDDDEVQSNVDTAILAVSALETVFDENHDDFVDDDPSFQCGGGDSGGGGADDSW